MQSVDFFFLLSDSNNVTVPVSQTSSEGADYHQYTCILYVFQYEQNEKLIAVLKAPGVEYNDLHEVDRPDSRRQSLRGPNKRKMTNGDIMASLTEQDDARTIVEDSVTSSKPQEDIMSPRKSQGGDISKPEDIMTPRKSEDIMTPPRTAEKVPVQSKPFLPPVFLTVPVHKAEGEARPSVESQRRRKSINRLKLPKVEE